MNHLVLKTAILLVTMVVLLVLALTTQDVVKNELFSSFAIILGVYSSHQLSINNNENHE